MERSKSARALEGREGGREGWKVEGIKIVWIGGSM